MRKKRLVGALTVALLGAPLATACGGKTTSALEDASGPDAGDASVIEASPDAGPDAGDCGARGGVCLPQATSAPPNRRPAGPGEGACAGTDVCWVPVSAPAPSACTSDPECNPSPTISAIYGRCFFGVCVCNAGFHVQASGKCDRPEPPPCADQGGKCYQQQKNPTCPAGQLEGTRALNRTCGDLILAVCCTPEAACKGPTKPAGASSVPLRFVCCAPNDTQYAPACVNGWQTCLEGAVAAALPGGCG